MYLYNSFYLRKSYRNSNTGLNNNENEILSNSTEVPLEFIDTSYADYVNSTFYKTFNISLVVIFFLYYNISLFFYLKNRNHYLIKNKQVTLCIMISFICEIHCIFYPITALTNTNCWIQLWLTWFTATPKMIFNVARFLRLTFLQSKDRFRSNIINIKYYNSVGSSSFQFEDSSSLSLDINGNKDTPVTDMEKISFEPNLYYKIINKITQGKTGACLVTIPTLLFVTYCIILTINEWDTIGYGSCSMESIYLNKIFYAGFVLYVITLPFVGYQTFKYSHTIRKFDYLSYVFCLIIGFGTMLIQNIVTVTNYYVINFMGLTSYLMFVGAQFGAIVIPLIEVHIENKKKKNNALSINKYEFQRIIMDHNYFDMLREFAIQLFCVEVVLFWEMNFEIFYKVNRYLIGKKKILIERDKDIKSIRSLKNPGKQGLSTGVLKTSLDNENNKMSRKSSVADDIRSENSFNIRRNVSSLLKTTYDLEINRKASVDFEHPGDQPLPINYNDSINKFQNFDDLKESMHLGKRAQLLKRYLLDLNHGVNLYISSDCLSFHDDNFPIEFNKAFKASYDKLFQLFMEINAPALLNIKENTINNIKERLSTGDYSYDMYMDALDEILQLLYDNIYPKIYSKLNEKNKAKSGATGTVS